MSGDLKHVRAAFYGQVWALDVAKFGEIRAFLEGDRLDAAEVEARFGAGRRSPFGYYCLDHDEMLWADAATGELVAASGQPAQRRGSTVAVIGLHGTMVHRGSGMMAQTSGLTSAESVAALVRGAAADASVRGVVIDIDSGGGSVMGVTELAAAVREARKVKAVVALANAQAQSAAYWVAASASAVLVTPSGLVGSLGVYAAHEDVSAAAERAGVKMTLVSYGANKTLGNPFEPLSPEGRAELEKRVREYGQTFEADVAKGRGVSVDVVRGQFGQGLSFSAREAVERGMADAVGGLEDAIRRAAKGGAAAVAEVAEPAIEAEAEAVVEPVDTGEAERAAAILRARNA